MGSEPLSPHLQRNKQLQDTLLQRDEELIRLQDENKTLREFLGSSFVRNLQQRAKKLRPDGWRQLKRNPPDDGLFQTRSPSLHFPPPVSKRVCRNLSKEFSSSSSSSSSSEPNLDLWVLRTLGLKDRDTIDTSSESSSGFSTSFYDSSSSEYSLNSSFSFCPTSTPQTGYTNEEEEVKSPQSSTTSPQRNSRTIFLSPTLPEKLPFSPTSDHICCLASTRVPTHSSNRPVYWSPSEDPVQFSPPSQRVPFSPIETSGSQTPRSQKDLAFRMSISPSSSVKTHSFPQGQAFVRRDTGGGRCNFTWVPTQGH
ncbi:Geminin coiled-coil domain containing protein 1 [Dissostichus eleginoides]|uniref:Geminin coiled-coil domain containing protein 1 n=1 Tax=Dissostichus eleginoides TaxID=100907 RepID=A0AAD9CDM6_DISEL|nr:Geminin coiled-coil domain containing protein 1 [Dissostichus eleginoides]